VHARVITFPATDSHLQYVNVMSVAYAEFQN